MEMKIEKKHIIIALVVAVAAWLLWKRRKESVVTVTEVPIEGGINGFDPNNLDDCITVAFGNDPYAEVFRARVLYVQQVASRNESYRYRIKQHAASHGFTYPQELTYQGAYEECAKYPDSYSHKAYLQTVKDRLDAMTK